MAEKLMEEAPEEIESEDAGSEADSPAGDSALPGKSTQEDRFPGIQDGDLSTFPVRRGEHRKDDLGSTYYCRPSR